jgi:hypothetical protein
LYFGKIRMMLWDLHVSIAEHFTLFVGYTAETRDLRCHYCNRRSSKNRAVSPFCVLGVSSILINSIASCRLNTRHSHMLSGYDRIHWLRSGCVRHSCIMASECYIISAVKQLFSFWSIFLLNMYYTSSAQSRHMLAAFCIQNGFRGRNS